jgi:hypothetical protein
MRQGSGAVGALHEALSKYILNVKRYALHFSASSAALALLTNFNENLG